MAENEKPRWLERLSTLLLHGLSGTPYSALPFEL